MNRRRKAGWYMASFLAVSLGGIPAHAWPGDTRFQVEFETGAVWQSRNEIHIPDSADGTRFDLRQLQGSGPEVQRRVEVTWNVAHRHFILLVYAEVSYTGNGTVGLPILFIRFT